MKRHRMAKWVAFLLMLAIFLALSVACAEEYFEENGIEFRLLPDNTVEVSQITNVWRFHGDIPANAGGHRVSAIGDRALEQTSARYIMIPDGVTRIGDYAFIDSMINEITIPDSVRDIGLNPFAMCSYVNQINVSASHPVLTVLDGALYSKPDKRLMYYLVSRFQNLIAEPFSIPQGIQIIDNYAMAGYPGEIIIPDSVQEIGSFAFDNCRRLTTLHIPSSVTKIGANPFRDCSLLDYLTVAGDNSHFEIRDHALLSLDDRRVVYYPNLNTWYSETELPDKYSISDGIAEIGEYAFYSCELRKVRIPGSVQIIAAHAFDQCSNLIEASLPESLISIGEAAFENCRIKNIHIPSGVKTISQDAFNFCSIESLYISEGVETIEDGAFGYSDILGTLLLPSTLRTIGAKAFCSTNLESITLSEGLLDIGEEAFRGCNRLQEVNIPASVQQIGANAFSECTYVTIQTVSGSVGETYCRENNLTFSSPAAWDWLNQN